MQIKLKSLALLNFKGIRQMDINFSDNTSVYGDNATGKTTIFDAFCWLLFGKDSLDRKDFNIKTLQSSGEPLNKLDHSVTAEILVDGSPVTLQRIFREKWVKKRGETTAEFSGHETDFFINGVPYSSGDYSKAVSEIIPEQLFKLVTSPYYFNSMKWQDRRTSIIAMAGEITDKDVASDNSDFLSLVESGKSLESLKKEAVAKKKMLNDELSQIPSRIDELSRQLPEAQNVEALSIMLDDLLRQIAEVDGQILSKRQAFDQANKAILDRQNKIHALKRDLSEIEFSEKQKAQAEHNAAKALKVARESEVKRNQSAVEMFANDINRLQVKVDQLEQRKAELIRKWDELNAQQPVFGDDFSCPACKRALDPSDIEAKKAEITAGFNKRKQQDLQVISSEGGSIKQEIERLKNDIADAQKSLESKKEDLRTSQRLVDECVVPEVAEVDPHTVPAYQAKLLEIEALEKEQLTAPAEPDYTHLNDHKASMQRMADEKRVLIATQEQRGKGLKRLEELNARERELSQMIADNERIIDNIAAFEKAKIEAVEEKVNGLFSLVRFKMYNRLINGGEEPTCETTVNGVPFSDANHAAQINAGIDIVNAFSRFYNVTAPVFIDNAEAVTKLIDSPSQMIRLVVSENDKKLRVESENLVLANQ